MAWSEDPGSFVVTQFEDAALSKTITFTAPAAESVSYTSRFIDTFPSQTTLTGNTIYSVDLLGFFDIYIKCRMKDNTFKKYLEWEDLDADVANIKEIIEYHPPQPGREERFYEITAAYEASGTLEPIVEVATFGIRVNFDHSPGIAKLHSSLTLIKSFNI